MSSQHQRRVAITGLGAITNIGSNVDTFWSSLCEGKTHVSYLDDLFDCSDLACHIAARVTDFDAKEHLDPKKVKRSSRFLHFAIVAARQAIEDSGLDLSRIEPYRVGAYIGNAMGALDYMEKQVLLMKKKGAQRVSPFLAPSIIIDMAAAEIAIDQGFKGPNAAVVSGCASAGHSMGQAMFAIRNGYADVMISGGSESAMCRIVMAGASKMKAVTTRNDDPQRASRPFDLDRDGFVYGEAAGILVLEELEHARRRGARIYGELSGYGATDDAYHVTAPRPGGSGGAQAMRNAMEDAGLNTSDVQYINAHGTSTPMNDLSETRGIKRAFKEEAKSLAVSSTKSMTGHTLGAASAVEGISTILTIVNGIIPPTINYTTPDPKCDLDYVPNTARETRVEAALSNSFGFGGHNCSLAFTRYNGR